jgi:NADPH:quinone reductase-like Zn-dependent oxidoreductase
LETMKAAVVSKYGAPSGVQVLDVEKPQPKRNELLVRIHATTVTAGDAMLRGMSFAARSVFGLFMGGLGKNKILGHEFAGVVEGVGEQVSLFRPGDTVFASAGMKGGAHAEYICVPESSMITEKPISLSYEEAAAIPIGGNTALDILRKADIHPRQKVLIYGASGSVGTYAVQLARYFGAEVTGVCSKRNHDLVRGLGASATIDYHDEDFTQQGETYDVVFDAVRKISKEQAERALTKRGLFLSVRLSTREKPENLVFLKELAAAGEFRPVIDRRFTLDKIVEAHTYVDTGRKTGNVVIKVADGE